MDIFTAMMYGRELREDQMKLMGEVEQENLSKIKKIIKGGCNPNFFTGNAISSSPLYLAAFRGNFKIVKWLIEEGGVNISLDDARYISLNLSRPEIGSYLSSKILSKKPLWFVNVIFIIYIYGMGKINIIKQPYRITSARHRMTIHELRVFVSLLEALQ